MSSLRALAKHKKYVRRETVKHSRILGEIKFQNDVRLNAIAKGVSYHKHSKAKYNNKNKNNFKKPVIRFTDRITPPYFTLKYEHCIPVIQFINDLKSLGQQGKHINIIMNDVVEIGEGAIAMLLSVINEIGSNAVLVKGTKPKDPEVNKTLEKSGFFKYIATIISAENINTKNAILRTGGKFGCIDHLFSFVIDHQEKRLFYNLQPSIYNVNQILLQVVSGFRKWFVHRIGIFNIAPFLKKFDRYAVI